MLTTCEAMLGRDGPFASALPGFAPRTAQQAMAEAVATAMENRSTLICEAGTGTGKTFAYLVPALMNAGKIVISTGTKTLQDQLFHRDLPMVRKALDVPVRVALLKGRANYVCLHRLDAAEREGRLAAPTEVDELHRISLWSRRTRSGDIAEVDEVPEDTAVWPLVTSTTDNCLGQECGRFNDCFVLKARRAAQEADVVVINHHILLADMALKEEGFGELLPSADAFVIDEAHQLPETASQFFGTSVSSRQLIELARDTVMEHNREAGDMGALVELAHRLEKTARDARLTMGAAGRRGAWRELREDPAVNAALERIQTALGELRAALERAAERGKGLHHCWQRSDALGGRLALFQRAVEDEQVQWFETYARSFVLHMTPLQIGNVFENHRRRFRAGWIFTSATLAVGEDFSHFSARLGVEDGDTAQWESPFDFKRNTLLYMPNRLPLPAESHYTAEVVKAALPVLQASGGRAFMLFTSHRALQEAAALLKDRIVFPLLVQGSAPRRELLQRFRGFGNAVLLGTGSFWEGVDVRGPALSLVIIDKLPFASPGEPVLQARLESVRRRGGEPFHDYQLPQAVIALKQGVGRLIRDSRDRGVLMLCDPRLSTKGYGRVFLKSLPPMAHARDLADVQRFFAEEAPPGDAGDYPVAAPERMEQ
jgi:ATP-dependent DNA helicase DinG